MPPISTQGAGSLYERLVTTRPRGAEKYRSMRRYLAVFDSADLYDYACPEGVSDPRAASNEELLARVDQRVGDWMRNTSNRSAAEKLAARAHEIFVDDVQRRYYDEYLQWCDLKAVFDGLGTRLEGDVGSCSPDDVAAELGRLRELLGSRSQAEALMESFLASRGIRYDDAGPARHAAVPADGMTRSVDDDGFVMTGVLPESALEPSTPPPPASSPLMDGPSAYSGGAQVVAGMVTVQSCPNCGAVNAAAQAYCRECNYPLDGSQPGFSAPPYGPPPAEKKFPIVTVVVVALLAVILAGGATYIAMNGLPDLGPQGSASSTPASSSNREKGTVRVSSNSTKTIVCVPKTIIVPYDADEEPLDSYKVELKRKQDGVAVETMLSISGTGGFTFADFDGGDVGVEDVPAGTYQVIMTDNDNRTVCEFTADYKEKDSNAAKKVQVVAHD